MIRDATKADLPAIRELLASSNDSPYDASAVAEEKCFGDGVWGAPRTLVTSDLSGVAVLSGRFLRLLCVRRDRRREGIGTALLRELRPEVIGAEPGNYFTPGIREEDAPFFIRHGYKPKSETWNLHAELSGGQAPSPVLIQRGTGEGACPPQTLAFIEQHFGRIWRFEAARARTCLWIENTGFAAVEANNRGLGTFGPTGVAEALRGRGFGRVLLLAALAELRAMGFRRAVIPWTDALAFYEKSCGAQPAHRFVTYTSRP